MTTTKQTKKSLSELAEMQREAERDAMAAAEFMVLLECEGRCEVNSAYPDRRKHCRRMDTVAPAVYLQNGTREGSLCSLGRVCMKHLPAMISLVKRESPGGNGAEFKQTAFDA